MSIDVTEPNLNLEIIWESLSEPGQASLADKLFNDKTVLNITKNIFCHFSSAMCCYISAET